jgi:hypothetical protein
LKRLLVISLLLFSLAYASNPVSVPARHPIYNYFERMETLGYLTNILDGIRPFSRTKAARLLKILEEKRAELTPIDQRRLDDFLLDFRYELNPSKKYAEMPDKQNWYSVLASWTNFKKDFKRFFKQNHPEEENHVVMWENESSNFYFDYEQGLTYEKRLDNMYRSASWQSYKFRGLINNNFGYALEVSLHGLRGDEGYIEDHPILKGSWSQKKEDEPRYSDRTGGELAWNTKYIDFNFAQQEVEWGHGESGKLILSNNPEHYPYISLSKEWGWGKFIAVHGKLQSFAEDTTDEGAELYPDKWLASHRLEFSLWRRLTIGLNENFIYGNRYADWAYLIPFNFYRSVQHKLRDRDNATISVDLELLVYRGGKIYGAVFLDEFKRSELFTDWYGNKHAFLFGFYQVDPFSISNFSVRFEYTAIMPWVYTHKYKINSYTTDYNSLGHWAGPNSEVYYLHLAKDWHQRLSTGLKFRQWKHGANYDDKNIGGDILIGHSPSDPQTRKFLEGILTTEKRYEIYCNYEIFNDFFLSGRYSYINLKTQEQTEELNEFYFGFKFEY